jgi:ABC-2 type transport system ATP-binding protein
MTAMIQAEGLLTCYGKLRAVEDVHLSVAPGELYCFLGPNGAGKTTTIKMLIGLLRPDAGSVRIGGLDVWTEPVRAKAMIGYVPDAAHLYDQLTAREFLGFVADIFRMGASERARRIDRLLSAFELADDADQLIGGFSRGMRQKVVLSAALLHDPQAIFLDEPTVGLDPRAARTLKDLLLEACGRGAAVFMSTHILEVAETMADRVGIIQHGKMLYQGSVAGLREYQHGPASASLEDLFLALTAPVEPHNA